MGFYIETGTTHCKAKILEQRYQAKLIPQPASFSDVPKDKALVCVVDNTMFEAAGYCFDEAEFKVFTEPKDTRPKEWLLMDLDTAQSLSRFKNSYEYRRMNNLI